MRKIYVALAAPTGLIIPSNKLDKRSMPAFRISAHGVYIFLCRKIFKEMQKGTFKTRLVQKDPKKWVKQVFKTDDPKVFLKKTHAGIDMTKIKKYVNMLKEDPDPSKIPPIIFAKDYKKNKSYFIDGNHRSVAAFLAGIPKIPCYEIDMSKLLRAYYLDKKGQKKRIAYRDADL